MVGDVLLYTGSIVIVLWGIAHIVPTKSVVDGFGSLTVDNWRIITMEWIAEGLTLCFVGLLVLLSTVLEGSDTAVSTAVYRACASMLLVMAGLSLLTGARTSILPMKLCPLVKTTVALLFFAGSAL